MYLNGGNVGSHARVVGRLVESQEFERPVDPRQQSGDITFGGAGGQRRAGRRPVQQEVVEAAGAGGSRAGSALGGRGRGGLVGAVAREVRARNIQRLQAWQALHEAGEDPVGVDVDGLLVVANVQVSEMKGYANEARVLRHLA